MKKDHVLKEKAYVYDLPHTKPDMNGVRFDSAKGYWISQSSNQPSIEDKMFAAPRTKKADVETGEDRKGE